MEGETNISDITENVWPKWLLESGPDLQPSLDRIISCRKRLGEAVQGVYVYDAIFQQPLTSTIDQLVALQALDAKSGRIQKPFKMARDIEMMQLYQNGSGYRLLGMLCVSRQMALVHLIDGATTSLTNGNLVVGLLCIRSVIEHVALFDFVITDLKSYSLPFVFNQANIMLGEISGKLGRAARATRVDWAALAQTKDSEAFDHNKIKYKPKANREDLTARQIMNLIDGLEKRVKRIRAVYEVLCEFAHPNIGLLYSLTRSAKPFLDAQGVGWIRKELTLEPPSGFVKEMGPIFAQVFAKIAECLTHFERLSEQADEQKQRVLQLTQTVIRHLLAKRRDLVTPYAPCPCGGGSKVKFCCGG